MAWKVEFNESAKKDLAKLDKQNASRITKYIRERLMTLDNPRLLGEPLTGKRLGEFWKYRVGDYRMICKIEDEVMRVLVVKIGNRREVYR